MRPLVVTFYQATKYTPCYLTSNVDLTTMKDTIMHHCNYNNLASSGLKNPACDFLSESPINSNDISPLPLSTQNFALANRPGERERGGVIKIVMLKSLLPW